MTVKVSQYFGFIAFLMAIVCPLSGCSDDDSTPREAVRDIRFSADIWQVMDATRASIFGAGAVNGSFMVYAYNYNSETNYINGKEVIYSDGVSSWADTPQRWPESGALDFFAFMPTTLPSYCTFNSSPYANPGNVDGYSAGNPRIVCSGLPVSLTAGSDDTQELVYAYIQNQSKAGQGATGVTLTFKRPFARVYFKLADGLSSLVTINQVTIAGIKNNGTCSFDGSTTTWTPSGDATNLEVTAPSDGSPATGDTPYLILPQDFASNLTFTVNATWTDWSNVTKDVSASVNVGSWQAGYSYTYTFTLSKYALKVETTRTYTEQW